MSTGRRVEADGRERAADACRSDADARERAVDVRSGHRVRGCAVDLRRSSPDVGVRAVDACGSDADVPNARAKTGRRAPPMSGIDRRGGRGRSAPAQPACRIVKPWTPSAQTTKPSRS
jgi:hypothetical protein